MTAQHNHKTLYKSMIDTYQQVGYSLRLRTASCTESWFQYLAVIYVGKVSSWNRNYGPVTPLQDRHHRNTSHQSHRCYSTLKGTQRHTSLSNTQNFPYPRRNCFSTYWYVLVFVTQKQKGHPRSIQHLPKRPCMPQICLQIKYRTKINT